MIGVHDVRALKSLLFAVNETTAFAILDGAIMPGLPAVLESFRPEYRCLYRGELEPDMAEVAPYLVALEREAPFTEWLLMNAWGANWATFGVSRVDLPPLHRHLRRFVKIDHGNKPVYFRYYSPLVMRHFLPACNVDELRTIFGPVLLYLVEDEDPRFARTFQLRQGELRQTNLLLNETDAVSAASLVAGLGSADEPAGSGTLTERAERSRIMGDKIYAERMRRYLNETFPETRDVPREEMDRTILDLTESAAGYKLILETHVAPFIVAAWLFGKTFDGDFPAVQAVLEDYEMDTGMKAQWLWNFIEETVGILEDGMQE